MSTVNEAIRAYLVEEAAYPPLNHPEAWEQALAEGGYGYFSEFDIADVLEEHADELEALASDHPQSRGYYHNRNLNGQSRR